MWLIYVDEKKMQILTFVIYPMATSLVIKLLLIFITFQNNWVFEGEIYIYLQYSLRF